MSDLSGHEGEGGENTTRLMGAVACFSQRFSRKQYFVRFDVSRHSALEALLEERRGQAGEFRTPPLKLEIGAAVLLSNNFGEMFRLELALETLATEGLKRGLRENAIRWSIRQDSDDRHNGTPNLPTAKISRKALKLPIFSRRHRQEVCRGRYP